MRDPKTIGRPREFDEEETLARIMDVFWAKGFEGASMSDLVVATGVKKGSLYAAFGDKRAMYLKSLAHYDRTAIDRSVHLLTGTGPAAKRIGEFLQSTIDAVALRKDRRGCFLCNASLDQAELDPETEQAVKGSFERLGHALEQALTELPLASSEDATRHGEAQHLLSVYFGLRVLAKGGHPVKALEVAKQVALRSISLASRD